MTPGRLPHPFALFAKGWATTTASTMDLCGKNQKNRHRISLWCPTIPKTGEGWGNHVCGGARVEERPFMAAFASKGFALQGLRGRRAEARRNSNSDHKRGSKEPLFHKFGNEQALFLKHSSWPQRRSPAESQLR